MNLKKNIIDSKGLDLNEIHEVAEQNAPEVTNKDNLQLSSNLTKRVQFNFDKGSHLIDQGKNRNSNNFIWRKSITKQIGDGRKYCITDINHNDLR